MALSLRQRARLAAFVARPDYVIFWLKVMGGLVLVALFLVGATLFFPQMPMTWLNGVTRSITVLNFASLFLRFAILRLGWLPVSASDLDAGEFHLGQASHELQIGVLQRVQRRGWLRWADIWALQGAPTGVEAWSQGQRWRPENDRPAREADVRALLTLPVVRHARALETPLEVAPKPRERQRT